MMNFILGIIVGIIGTLVCIIWFTIKNRLSGLKGWVK